MRPIVLSGFMATGKSTLGARVAARTGARFVDTDAVIASETETSIADLWNREGEARFRARELALVERLFADPEPKVIAFGGGTVTLDQARRVATERAIVVTLTASPETIVARAGDLSLRPNLTIGGDPLARARELVKEREEAYAECHLSLATDALDKDDAVDEIVALAERDPLLVPLGARSYTVDVALACPTRLTDAIARCAPSSLVVVTDSNVLRARKVALDAALAPMALRHVLVTLPPGERHKTPASVAAIWDAALGSGIDRDALVVAFGGGVVGDMAGFAAATLLRGIRFVQVPTTLLAMVDASVGGKTGFDHPTGKNLIGAFHQPSGVVADLDHLRTLPARERTAGLAEIVKIALATDAALLDALEQHAPALGAGEEAPLAEIVRSAIVAKIRVVRDDERERGLRALLNVGHTAGHALEAHGGFSRFLHGEAVALGTLLELEAGAALGVTPPPLVARVRRLLVRLGLPSSVARGEMAAAWPFALSDKKRQRGSINIPLVTGAGTARLEKLPLERLRQALLGEPFRRA